MATCFVIQPFDSGKFDKRYTDVYEPAIMASGLEPYRVDRDPGVAVPIQAIEEGIRKASVCLADITTDNPNVWYELGFAYAADRPVVMVCSNERSGNKYPFDIQHRRILTYVPDSASDFEKLSKTISEALNAILNKDETIEKLANSTPVANVEGLSQSEVLVLGVVANNAFLPDSGVAAYSARHDAERAGSTLVGFNLGVKRLISKGMIEIVDIDDEREQETYPGLRVTEVGWNWIETNDSRFILHKPNPSPDLDLPF